MSQKCPAFLHLCEVSIVLMYLFQLYLRQHCTRSSAIMMLGHSDVNCDSTRQSNRVMGRLPRVDADHHFNIV